MEKFESYKAFSWITIIGELLNNSLANTGVPYVTEMFSKNKNNELVNNKIIKNGCNQRYEYKTFIEFINIKIIFFSGKL